MAVVVKVGPWGAPGGELRDIPDGSMSQSLVGITICSSKANGGAILGISFVYFDRNGEPIHVGPWGMMDPEHRIEIIEMGPFEYLYDLSGTFNDCALYSLKLVTNRHEYTVGNPGVPQTQFFSVPSREVVAFFGRSGVTLTALGVYVLNNCPVKLGRWGGPVGEPVDIPVGSIPKSLVRITICSSKAIGGPILGISFVYIDRNGEPIDVGPWGMIDPEQRITIIEMGPGEYIIEVSGTTDDSAGITSLTLVTNQQHKYSAGSPVGSAFSMPLMNGKVVAFFGRSDDTLKALGIYVAPVQDWPVKIGPWGGSGGETVDITTPVQLKSFTVYSTESSDGRIYGFSFTYIDQNGDSIDVGPWGTTKGHKHTIYLNQDEYLNNVSGTFDDDGVTSLKFTTNQTVYYTGCERGTAFSVPLPDDNGAVVGFFGRCDDNNRHDNDSTGGNCLNALGVYVGLAPKP